MAEPKHSFDFYWACLLQWLSNNVSGVKTLTRHSQRLLRVQFANVDKDDISQVQETLSRAFSKIS
jgi:hypothetical protein